MVRGDRPARRRHWSPHPLVLEVPLLLGTGLLPSAPMVVQVPEGSEAGQHDEQDAAGETHSQASHIDVSAPWEWEGARGERATALGTVTQSSNPAVLVSCSLRGATSNPGTPCPCQAADPTSSPALRIAGTCTQQAVTHHAAQRGDGAPTPAMRGGRGHRVGEGRGTPTLQTPAASSALQPLPPPEFTTKLAELH